MNIIDVKEMYNGGRFESGLNKFYHFYQVTGDDVKSGYLGSTISNVTFDNDNNLELSTVKVVGDLETESTCVMLDDTVLIKQEQKNMEDTSYQIFSWNKDYDKCTYILFDDKKAMDVSYDRIKKSNTCLCNGELNSKLTSLQIPISNILQVQEDIEINPVLSMIREEEILDDNTSELNRKII